MSIINWFVKKKEKPHGIVTNYKGNVVAWTLHGEDADCYMYEYGKSDDRPDCCQFCNNSLIQIPNKGVLITRGKWDIAATYDGYYVISEKFCNFLKDNNYSNLRIIPLERSKGLYFFDPMDLFALDYELYGTKFINKRECCGSYDEVIRPPIIKAKDYKIESNDFIMKAEYLFGSYNHKGPVIIVGTETAKKMKAYGLKGLYFEKIYDSKGLKIIKKEVEGFILD